MPCSQNQARLTAFLLQALYAGLGQALFLLSASNSPSRLAEYTRRVHSPSTLTEYTHRVRSPSTLTEYAHRVCLSTYRRLLKGGLVSTVVTVDEFQDSIQSFDTDLILPRTQ